MKLRIICFLLFFGNAASAQTYGGIYTDGTWTEKQVEKDLDKQIMKGKEKGDLAFSAKEKKGDTLIYTFRNDASSFLIKTTYHLEGKEPGVRYCDFEKYVFDCTCSQNYLKETLKTSGFRNQGDNKYLSSYAYKTKLTVEYKTENKDCLDMTFNYVGLSKQPYKEIYSKLSH